MCFELTDMNAYTGARGGMVACRGRAREAARVTQGLPRMFSGGASESSVDLLTDDIVVLLAVSLSVRDLGRLACAAPRFSAHKSIMVADEALSIVDAAARRQVEMASVEEQEWVPRRGTMEWRRILRELELLRAPLKFVRAHHLIVVDEGGSRGTKPGDVESQDFSARCALGSQVMRAGRHFVQLTDCTEAGLSGLQYCVRPPDWNTEGSGDTVQRFPSYGAALNAWYCVERSMTLPEDEVVVGLLLDLKQGTFSVYQKGVRRSHPSDPLPPEAERVWHRTERARLTRFPVNEQGYCWGVMFNEPYDSVRIASTPIPAIVSTLHEEEVAEMRRKDLSK